MGASPLVVINLLYNRNLHQRQWEDLQLKPLIEYLETGKLPDVESQAHKIQFMAQHHCLDAKGVLLWTQEGPGLVPRQYPMVVPSAIRPEIMEAYHDDVYAGGHLGFAKTLQKIKRHYYWPGMWVEVKHWCHTCVPCSMRKDPPAQTRAPLVPLPVVGAFDRVTVDCLGPLPLTENGNRHIVIFSDYLTRWIEAFCVPDIKASTIARLLVDEIITRHGAPWQLLSDQGTNFLSKLVAEICELFQTRKVNTTPYHPACDGLMERFNCTLLAMLACFVSSHQRDWDRFVPLVLFAYHCSAQASVGDSPFFLLYGCDPVAPIDVNLIPEPWIYQEIEDYRADISLALQEAWKLARQHLMQAQDRQKQYYDQTVRNYEFSVGDRVWLHTPATKKGKSPKLSCMWQGPYRVTQVFTPNVRIVPVDAPRQKETVVHVNWLKPCYTSHVPNPAALLDEAAESSIEEVNSDSKESTTTTSKKELVVQPQAGQIGYSERKQAAQNAQQSDNIHKYNLRARR